MLRDAVREAIAEDVRTSLSPRVVEGIAARVGRRMIARGEHDEAGLVAEIALALGVKLHGKASWLDDCVRGGGAELFEGNAASVTYLVGDPNDDRNAYLPRGAIIFKDLSWIVRVTGGKADTIGKRTLIMTMNMGVNIVEFTGIVTGFVPVRTSDWSHLGDGCLSTEEGSRVRPVAEAIGKASFSWKGVRHSAHLFLERVCEESFDGFGLYYGIEQAGLSTEDGMCEGRLARVSLFPLASVEAERITLRVADSAGRSLKGAVGGPLEEEIAVACLFCSYLAAMRENECEFEVEYCERALGGKTNINFEVLERATSNNFNIDSDAAFKKQ